MTYRDKNLACLQNKEELLNLLNTKTDLRSTIEVVDAKNGSPTLRVADGQGKMFFLHSSYNPEAEGSKAVAGFNPPTNQMVVVFGLGLGYHVEALLRKLDPKARVFIIEGRGDIFAKAIEVRDLSKVLEDHRVTIALGDERLRIASQFSQTFNITREAGIAFFDHAASIRLNPKFYEEAAGDLRDEVSLQLSTIATLINFKDLWIKNNLLNLRGFVNSPGVNELFDQFSDMPAIIIAAGPSLNKNIHRLAQAKGKALLICVGTALKAVLKAGIEPDLVVTYDAGEANFRHFKGLDISDIPLVFDPMVHPEIVRQHHGRKFVLSVGNEITSWIENIIGSKGFVKAGGSVATLAFSLAISMGCNPVALVGQDLGFPGGQTHARGTVYEENLIDEKEANLHYFYIPANDGGQILTNRGYYSFLVWFQQFIKTLPPDKKIINATEGGAKIEGTQLIALSDYIKIYCQRDISKELDILQRVNPVNKPDNHKLVGELAKVIEALNVIRKRSAIGAGLAGELYNHYLNDRFYNEEKTLKELNSIDRTIKRKQEEVTFINQAMQEVLISITRGQLSMINEGETLKEKNLRIAKLSKVLYEGINETVSSLYESFTDALELVRIDLK